MNKNIEKINVPLPDGTTKEAEIITYYQEFFDPSIGKKYQTYIKFYPNNGVTIGKYLNEFYHVAVTLIKEDIQMLLLPAIKEEEARYVENIEDNKPEDLTGLDSFKEFFDKMEGEN